MGLKTQGHQGHHVLYYCIFLPLLQKVHSTELSTPKNFCNLPKHDVLPFNSSPMRQNAAQCTIVHLLHQASAGHPKSWCDPEHRSVVLVRRTCRPVGLPLDPDGVPSPPKTVARSQLWATRGWAFLASDDCDSKSP